jgi:4-hydroxy-tetrahydrodipicolinate synthase
MTLTRENLKGSMVALVTPFQNGKIDEPTVKRLIDFHIQEGTDVIVPCGTTGEAATMTHEEHKWMMSFVIEYVNKRVPVICGAGSNSTEEAVGLVRHAKETGADAVLMVTPYYNKPTQEGLYRHYEYLAKKVDIPIVLYNVPGRTGISIAPETVQRLAKIPTIIGIKEASGSLDQASKIMSLCDLPVVSGEDSINLPLLSIGAKGVISVVANVAPRKMHEMIQAFQAGDAERAKTLHYELFGLSKVLFIETNPIPVKTALALMKMVKEEFRLPLCEIGKEARSKLIEELKKSGLLK